MGFFIKPPYGFYGYVPSNGYIGKWIEEGQSVTSPWPSLPNEPS